MTYSTITDLTRWIEEEELIALCTRSGGATIESADAEIDGYLLARWPGLRDYSPVPDEINRISAIFAVYNLYLRRRAVSDPWQQRCEDCRRRLEAAADGKFTLGLDDSGSVATGPNAACRTDADETLRVYTKDKLKKL